MNSTRYCQIFSENVLKHQSYWSYKSWYQYNPNFALFISSFVRMWCDERPVLCTCKLTNDVSEEDRLLIEVLSLDKSYSAKKAMFPNPGYCQVWTNWYGKLMQQVLLNRGAAAEESITVSKDGNIRAVEALRLSQEDHSGTYPSHWKSRPCCMSINNNTRMLLLLIKVMALTPWWCWLIFISFNTPRSVCCDYAAKS